jgi:hypothetical protein
VAWAQKLGLGIGKILGIIRNVNYKCKCSTPALGLFRIVHQNDLKRIVWNQKRKVNVEITTRGGILIKSKCDVFALNLRGARKRGIILTAKKNANQFVMY